jgi:hypothetical protein
MKAKVASLLLAFVSLFLNACSSVGVYDLHKSGTKVSTAPRLILVEPFRVKTSNLHLGKRTPAEKSALGHEISKSLARRTSGKIRRYAAPSVVTSPGRTPATGTWLVQGQILKVDQGSRALRAGVGLGAGRTYFRTQVTVTEVSSSGARRLLTFRTTGHSGLEPGAALGVIGGAGAAKTAGGMLFGSLAGVNSDIDRTAFEIAATLSAYLSRLGLLDPTRQALAPNMAGRTPSTFNSRRMLPAAIRE